MWPALAIGAGIGAGKYFLEDKPKRKAAMLANAEGTRGSWTGVPVSRMAVPDASLIGGVTQGAALGGSMGQSIGALGQSQKLQDAQLAYMGAAQKQMERNPDIAPSPMQMQQPAPPMQQPTMYPSNAWQYMNLYPQPV